jgi:cytochrome c biogenesis protein CcdA
MDEQRATYVSALIYTAVALLGAVAFFAVTTLRGDYDWVARLGGAGWVFLLSMIILMPTVTPLVKRRLGGRQG